MDKNTIIGFLLIFAILIAWQLTMAPERKAIEQREQARLDSLRMLEEKKADSLAQLENNALDQPEMANPQDSLAVAAQQNELSAQYGPFAPASLGKESFEVLENDVMRIIFTNKGGRIKEVQLKDYFKVELDSNHKEIKLPLKLLEDDKNKFEYLLPVAGAKGGVVSSEKLFFQPQKQGSNAIVFRADAGQGRFFEQLYTIEPGSHAIHYELRFTGLDGVLENGKDEMQLHWVNYLDKLEQNYQYEANYSTVYYKPADEDYEYCSCTSNDEDDLTGKPIKWAASSNQFFASVLIAKDKPFNGGDFATEVMGKDQLKTSPDLKKLTTDLAIPIGNREAFSMEMYLGPKEFKTLAAYGNDLEDIIPFGRSIMGTANRWVIRPLFNFLSSFIGVKGIVILVLTLIVKLLLYPLSYKMLYSQAKMAALKPQLASLKEKFKDDPTQVQMESMKMYREFGVNPLGGCLPVVFQMPVWLALYRFFPASIEFRQVDFLWATDLSSYDTAFWLPFEIPFYGQHVSMFTLLWVVTTLIYTYYNLQQMDMANMGGGVNANMMKYMQYGMPIMFLFFFNNFASGLTCYLVFSNILNVAQTVLTKNVIIDNEKIKAELEAYRKKPKKKGGFQSRLEDALKQQQAIAAQREAAAASKGVKKKK
ncbi:MAG: membrane protein insertase YidC [Saprospiraceae bacterium]